MRKIFTLPTVLTLTRLVLSPLMLPVLLVYLLPYNNFVINIALAVLFLLLSLTDLFDGYFARKFNQVTKLGKQLDPLADKFLSYSTLVALLAAGKIFFYWVIILIGRDFFVMGLRAIAQDRGLSIPVSFFGRIKTIGLTIFLAFIIFNPYQAAGLSNSWNMIEAFLLVIVLLLSLLSAKNYYLQFREKLGLPEFLDATTLSGKSEDVEQEKHDADHYEWPEDPDVK